MLDDKKLFRVRVALVQAFLREHGYDGVLLTRADNYAMATGGKRNYVYTCGDFGANALFVDKDGGAWFLGSTIEEPRQMAEELGSLGCESKSFLWFEDTPAAVAGRAFSGSLVSDDGALGENVHGKLAVLRALLTETELEKYRRLGRLAAEAMTATLDRIEEGMFEAEISAALVAEGQKRRCQVPIALVAADERIARFRHPLPTQAALVSGPLEERPVRGYVMVVGGFLREGLVVSITRFKRVGEMPSGTEDAYARICGVDALMQEATVPGRTLGDVFADCQRAYTDLGFDSLEWHHHHQGGATGYAGRTCKGAPGESFPVLNEFWPPRAAQILGEETALGAAFAWNPSAPGVKSEDTFLVVPGGTREVVTRTPALPDVDLIRVLGRPTEVVKSGIVDG